MNKLVPLRIPHAWMVSYNSFIAEEMVVENAKIKNYLGFKEDLLVIEECGLNNNGNMSIKENGHFLDLGWYPDSDPDGSYTLKLMKGSRENTLLTFRSTERRKIADVIELCLEFINTGSFNAETILNSVV